MANFCRREIQKGDEPVKYCDKAVRRVNALDWCQDCRDARLPIWPTGEPIEKPKHHAAFDRKTGEGQEHLGPRGIESFVKTDEFTEAGS